MRALVRSELLKQRTTRTSVIVLGAMAVLVALIVLMHVPSMKADQLALRDNQFKILGWGTTLGALFASILGALSITAEIRHGSIRSTLLATPRRSRVIVAKTAASVLTGLALGLLAEGLVAALEAAVLGARGIPITLTGGDYAQLLVGGAVAAGLFAAIGVGIGAAIRNQVGVIVGLLVWMLLIETTLGDSFPSADKFTPSGVAGAIAGAIQTQAPSKLVAPAIGVVLLALYAAAAVGWGANTMTRRDVT
jgi:ABC-2 type transport system permease protein